MPAEWAPHSSTWFSWPRADGISFPDEYERAVAVFVAFIRQLAKVENVNIIVWNYDMEEFAREQLEVTNANLNRVQFHHFKTYEPWCRDHGPIFLTRSGETMREQAIVDWDYNAWGDKYPPYDLDNAIPAKIAQLRNLPLFKPNMVLEGGSIDVNGQGSLLTTEACLLNPNRNPTLSKPEIEQRLRDFLGVQTIIWLGDGIVGDDTDGHIDDISRFVAPDTIVTVVEEDPSDENYALLQDNLNRLQAARDQNGNPFRIVTLPMPGKVEFKDQRLPASYANFYIANKTVIVPTYDHKNDTTALEILQKEFPDRKVVGIDSTGLIWGLGSFHCISQQEPA